MNNHIDSANRMHLTRYHSHLDSEREDNQRPQKSCKGFDSEDTWSECSSEPEQSLLSWELGAASQKLTEPVSSELRYRLYSAILSNDARAVNQALRAGAPIDEVTDPKIARYNRTPIYHALAADQNKGLQALRELLRWRPSFVFPASWGWEGPFLLAVSRKCFEAVRMLLKAGARLDTSINYRTTHAYKYAVTAAEKWHEESAEQMVLLFDKYHAPSAK